jgi:hypothetical protein
MREGCESWLTLRIFSRCFTWMCCRHTGITTTEGCAGTATGVTAVPEKLQAASAEVQELAGRQQPHSGICCYSCNTGCSSTWCSTTAPATCYMHFLSTPYASKPGDSAASPPHHRHGLPSLHRLMQLLLSCQLPAAAGAAAANMLHSLHIACSKVQQPNATGRTARKLHQTLPLRLVHTFTDALIAAHAVMCAPL